VDSARRERAGQNSLIRCSSSSFGSAFRVFRFASALPYPRLSRKNSCSSPRHSSASTPRNDSKR